MSRDKLPARKVVERYEHQAALDRLAIEAIGNPLEVPRFCREMARLLEGDRRIKWEER